MKAKAKTTRKQNKKSCLLGNAGMTMAELLVTFALLGIFLVAATRMISYVIGIYYAASGNTYGLQVSNMVSNKIIGQMEGASTAMIPVVTVGKDGIDSLKFIDETGSSVTVTATPETAEEDKPYLSIVYDAVSEGSIKYDEVDWRFDSKAYMGYYITRLEFEDPEDGYPDNVLKMELTLHSEKYGDYDSVYYIKCINVEKIEYKTEYKTLE